MNKKYCINCSNFERFGCYCTYTNNKPIKIKNQITGIEETYNDFVQSLELMEKVYKIYPKVEEKGQPLVFINDTGNTEIIIEDEKEKIDNSVFLNSDNNCQYHEDIRPTSYIFITVVLLLFALLFIYVK